MGLGSMIRQARAAPCEALETPVSERSPDQIVDAGVKAGVSSDDCVAFLVYACDAVPILKPVIKMFVGQFLRRNAVPGE